MEEREYLAVRAGNALRMKIASNTRGLMSLTAASESMGITRERLRQIALRRHLDWFREVLHCEVLHGVILEDFRAWAANQQVAGANHCATYSSVCGICSLFGPEQHAANQQVSGGRDV